MGNYISCTSTTSYPQSTRVIFPSGRVQQFHQPVNAAELMLEAPSHFLANSSALQVGRRFSALSADEDLEMGNLYIMFPMRRVNSLVTPSDVGLLIAADAAIRRVSSGKATILLESETEVPSLNMDDKEEDESVCEFRVRCRSWKPLLETISEEIV